jgi:secondary thiamine-phosphate synthase enzyme
MIALDVATKEKQALIDVTGRVTEIVRHSGVTDGLCVVFSPHTTAGVTINEHADPAVSSDVAADLDRLVPAGDRFLHSEGNSDAHVKTVLCGPSVTLLVEKGRVLLGTWQGIFLAEFDGPRRRQLWVKVQGR